MNHWKYIPNVIDDTSCLQLTSYLRLKHHGTLHSVRYLEEAWLCRVGPKKLTKVVGDHGPGRWIPCPNHWIQWIRRQFLGTSYLQVIQSSNWSSKIWSNFIATSHDRFPPKGSWEREITLFQGNWAEKSSKFWCLGQPWFRTTLATNDGSTKGWELRALLIFFIHMDRWWHLAVIHVMYIWVLNQK